ncbi:MarR family winged helix-turn-helix transcriptional regulator [Entomohabitans teleogrylli]|uniref:MarR family winged helix-turn-helix transcriptional regulator n=1 Tax=Entomohabitans teleogrylli TaxID=1384589 RepID=UPI00073DAD58|nr:MarR family winged helix-turn-helix transcriptional regulator [Entomohabitans teleogrylli]
MDYQTRELPTREALLRVQERENFTPDVSGVDLVLTLITTADLVRASIFDRLAKSYDISEGKFTLLMSLYAEGDTGASELAARIGVAPATVSVMVKRMLSAPQPLISMSRTSSDGRSRLIALTSAGQALIREALPGHFDAIRAFAEVLSETERESLITMLRKLLRKKR